MPHRRKEPISAAEVNAEIWQYVKRCDDLLREYHGAGGAMTTARDIYEHKFAHNVLLAEGTVQEKKAQADKDCRHEFLDFIQAETRFKYLKLALDTTRDQLVALESIGSNLRQENDLQKYKT
jgi:hypothetical protein